jgi:hypothetical protein
MIAHDGPLKSRSKDNILLFYRKTGYNVFRFLCRAKQKFSLKEGFNCCGKIKFPTDKICQYSSLATGMYAYHLYLYTYLAITLVATCL